MKEVWVANIKSRIFYKAGLYFKWAKCIIVSVCGKFINLRQIIDVNQKVSCISRWRALCIDMPFNLFSTVGIFLCEYFLFI